MRAAPTCPRCDGPLQPPGLWSDGWGCAGHGSVAPLHAALAPSAGILEHAARRSTAPVWLPWALPLGWLVTGARVAGEERTGPVATVVALGGPNPVPAPGAPGERAADLLLVAEQPGVGLGARYAGVDAVDPGPHLLDGGPHAKVMAAGQATPLWNVPSADDRAVYVGEALGVWLWVVLFPASAGALLLEELALVDLREPGHALDVPMGAPSLRLG